MNKIELGIPKKHHTIYRDIVSLPDPVKLGITIRYFNHDDVGLYFKITGSGTGYTFETVELGSLGSGTDSYKNLDEFASRAKPSGETQENITLTLTAYTDSGYTNLKWTYERTVSVVFIKSDDVSYTVEESDDFDDGTVQGWAVTCINNCDTGFPKIQVVSDYVLSAPYSLRCGTQTTSLTYNSGFKIWKNFTTPDKDTIYAIFNVRLSRSNDSAFINAVLKMRDATIMVNLGSYWAPYATEKRIENLLPLDKWMRVVVPLPRNVTIEIGIHSQWSYSGKPSVGYVHQDDFKIISK